ncbi:helix-turn-helix domain-containing protein [Cytobacillus horneckiae]|nr:helix-turn-helix domain-containing protein [Cytobacillus horneckiae]MEC1158762.1 helix-turn-helix domain-containing protein [Cytobacillus horneckiae]MED2937285.1 helix-turn-helix domain-containing protein [Cytobacillus horneckiae]
MNIVEIDQWINAELLPDGIRGRVEPTLTRPLSEIMEDTERQTIFNCLEAVDGKRTEAAKRLGISRTTLYEKMNKYGLLKE